MATVELRFSALPSHVRTARLVAAAMARRAGVDESLLDEVRLAVGEACSRAVALHRRARPDEAVRVTLTDGGQTFEVLVEDVVPEGASGDLEAFDDLQSLGDLGGSSYDESPADTGPLGPGSGGGGEALEAFPASVGLAVVTGLVDNVEVRHTASGSTVRMTWPADPRAASF